MQARSARLDSVWTACAAAAPAMEHVRAVMATSIPREAESVVPSVLATTLAATAPRIPRIPVEPLGHVTVRGIAKRLRRWARRVVPRAAMEHSSSQRNATALGRSGRPNGCANPTVRSLASSTGPLAARRSPPPPVPRARRLPRHGVPLRGPTCPHAESPAFPLSAPPASPLPSTATPRLTRRLYRALTDPFELPTPSFSFEFVVVSPTPQEVLDW